ncbi:hypothetical protein FNB15_03505 [Ferrovibrio terrae]|uniref:DUF7064 domain-containing protein n=1 Tax=Ferrovibrio terrae TaxID=2594003 RepID=A0A516GXZ4_9PROT|nr:hypothetical protein [Ferrovibrio terrae]QDO96401.1 hypothetical protein FNB15_03505 [Ferrovibrio terrae]
MIRNITGMPAAKITATDDLRHRAAPGQRMRDSLFWQCVVPEQRVGLQAYLYLTDDGKAGFNVVIWGEGSEPLVMDLAQGEVPAEMDFDAFSLQGLSLVQPAGSNSANLAYRSERLTLNFDFTGRHDPFSYHQNPDGLPSWFAIDRFEQTGWVRGIVRFGDREIVLDHVAHRDHSWGMRQWAMPQHWKWLIAYTPDASRIVNAWLWQARGDWGAAGYIVRDGLLSPIATTKQQAGFDRDMTQRSLRLDIADTVGNTCVLEMNRFGIMKLPAGGRHPTMIMEAACTASIDGQLAAGQYETFWPQTYLDRLIALQAN